ncbi:hypothetical protein H0H87_010085 [Tephrocybe sp. NHM501043]|nr:hypothetical protein H0H87_010085 [Tephrocybe sp. NHM501043]
MFPPHLLPIPKLIQTYPGPGMCQNTQCILGAEQVSGLTSLASLVPDNNSNVKIISDSGNGGNKDTPKDAKIEVLEQQMASPTVIVNEDNKMPGKAPTADKEPLLPDLKTETQKEVERLLQELCKEKWLTDNSKPLQIDNELNDEDFTSAIHLHLQEIAKDGYFKAQDIVDFIMTTKMQEKLLRFGAKKTKITVRIGRLKHGNEEARLIFKAGINQDGYFTVDNLIEQVDKAINIFEEKMQGFVTELFLFNNVPSYQKHADNALSA